MGLREFGKAFMLSAALLGSAEARAEAPEKKNPAATQKTEAEKGCDTSCKVPTLEKKTDKKTLTMALRNLHAEIQDLLETDVGYFKKNKDDYIKQLDEITQSNPGLFESDDELMKLRRLVVKSIAGV